MTEDTSNNQVVASTHSEEPAQRTQPIQSELQVPATRPESQAPEQENVSFAEMLAAQEDSEPANRLETGQRVKATVVAITADTVFVSTGRKVDGIVERAELEKDGELTCQIGDELDLYVVHVSPQEVRLSKVLRGAGGLEALTEAKEAGLPVEGKVTGAIKGGFSVDIMRRRAFCPASQMDVRPVDSPESIVGKTFNFLITKLEQHGRNIVVSRRVLLEAEQAEGREAFFGTVSEGDVLQGTVTRLMPFGAFVELAPGVEGLVHVSELSWSRTTQTNEVLSVGETVRVKLLSVSKDDKGATRVSLSIRQITEDPWNAVADQVHVGDVVSGKVVRLSNFGAFVEILPGVDGLVHLSEMSWGKRVHKADEVVHVGDQVQVKIKEIDLEKRRVSLSLRDALGDPWVEVAEAYPLESIHTGKVEQKAAFGLFINLAPGVTGLMPNSLMNGVVGRDRLNKLVPGDEVQVSINAVDLTNRRISLAPAGADAEPLPASAVSAAPGAPEGRKGPRRDGAKSGKPRGPRHEPGDEDWKRHQQQAPSFGGFGTLGAALQQALHDKKDK